MKNALSLLLLRSVITTSLAGASEILNPNESGPHPMAIETQEESSALMPMATEQDELELPPEILHHICSFTDVQTLGQLALTSKFTNQLTKDLREASRTFLNLKVADLNKEAIQEKLARFPYLRRVVHLNTIEEAKQLSSLPIDTRRFIFNIRELYFAFSAFRSKFLARMNYLANTPYLGNLNSLELINNKMPEQDAPLVANILHSAPLLTTLVLKNQQLGGGWC
ncbi:F-box protein [Candidatus Odyssella thessalonicensis]|uniref:F-box protein n=1 Tax=Candidatus Odyssella thessalonicensis TaxID=84647 RepID=UPI000225AF73|nr:F-box protein [Candidatus Odyssella thessalonicensis]